MAVFLELLQRIKNFISNKKPPKSLWIFLALVLIMRIIFLLATQYVMDDAFITYRYVRNILSGSGFVFNVGEKVLGTTSPLYTLLLSGLGFLIGVENVPTISLVISLCSTLVSAVILWNLIPRDHLAARFVTLLFVVIYPKVVLIDLSGMESSLAVMLMIFSLFAYLRRWLYCTAFSIALHLLCRPDTLIWNVLLIGLIYFRERKINLRYILPSLGILSPWFIFSWFYFGTIFPHSLEAKKVSFEHLFPAFDPVRVFGGYLPTPVTGNQSIIGMVILIVIFSIPFFIGMRALWVRKSILIIFPIFFLLYNLAFSFGQVLMTDWYYLPGYVAYLVTVGFFIEHLVMHWEFLNSRKTIRIFSAAIMIIMLLVFDVLGIVRWKENLGELFQRQNKALGMWLHDNAASNESVLVEPIGYVGYYSGLYIYDYVGIVSPEILQYRKRYDSDRWLINFLQEHKPDYLVLRNWEVPLNRLFFGYGDGMFTTQDEQLWFVNHYELVNWNPKIKRDSVHLVLYKWLTTNVTSLR